MTFGTTCIYLHYANHLPLPPRNRPNSTARVPLLDWAQRFRKITTKKKKCPTCLRVAAPVHILGLKWCQTTPNSFPSTSSAALKKHREILFFFKEIFACLTVHSVHGVSGVRFNLSCSEVSRLHFDFTGRFQVFVDLFTPSSP